MVKDRFKIGISLAMVIFLFGGCSNQPNTKIIEKTEIKKTPEETKEDLRKLDEIRKEKEKRLKKQKIIDSIEKDFRNKISKLYIDKYKYKYYNKVIKFSDNIKSWIDVDTGLIWEIKTKQNINDRYDWEDAKRYCSNLVLDGHSDWRLPNIDELKTLLTEKKYNGYYIKKPLSDNTKRYYWSDNIYAHNTDFAWGVYFDYANDSYYDKADNYYVRCVRVGEQ